jgi:hypothetical protein
MIYHIFPVTIGIFKIPQRKPRSRASDRVLSYSLVLRATVSYPIRSCSVHTGQVQQLLCHISSAFVQKLLLVCPFRIALTSSSH